jgi:hypothetical protein
MDATATPPSYTGRHVKGLSGTPNDDLVGALSRDSREDYYRRKKAIEMYLHGESEQAIYQGSMCVSKQTNITKRHTFWKLR